MPAAPNDVRALKQCSLVSRRGRETSPRGYSCFVCFMTRAARDESLELGELKRWP